MTLTKYNVIPFDIAILFLIWLFVQGCADKEPMTQTVNNKPLDSAVNKETKLIDVRPITFDLPEGHKLGKIGLGVLCIPMTDLVTIGGKASVTEGDFTNKVVNVLEMANYNLLNSIPNNTKSARLEGELELKGIVKDLQADICFPNGGFRSWKIGKGESYIKINWNLISGQTDQIIFETTTEGSYELKEAIAYGPEKVILGSVAVATENFLLDKNLVNLVLSSTK